MEDDDEEEETRERIANYRQKRWFSTEFTIHKRENIFLKASLPSQVSSFLQKKTFAGYVVEVFTFSSVINSILFVCFFFCQDSRNKDIF